MSREQSDILVRIKRALLTGRYIFSNKARREMIEDSLTEIDIVEAIISAPAIHKKIRSRAPQRSRATEYLYVIEGVNLDGLLIYTKGKFVKDEGREIYYFLISSKRAIYGGENYD